jgi:predicted enzyme related to lactoylglutathione lyase
MAQDSPERTQSDSTGVDGLLARHGGLSYLEIPATDARRSAAFYQDVFGWKLRGEDANQPKFSDQTGHLIGKWVTGRAISRRPGLLPFIYVDRIDDVVKHVAVNGGEIVKAPYREGNLWVSLIRDPAGNFLGVWQEDKP